MIRKVGRNAGLLAVLLCALTAMAGCSSDGGSDGGANAPNLPPVNPFLADSNYPIGHGESAQQDATGIAGPTGPTQALAPEQRNYAQIGPGHFGIYISGRCRPTESAGRWTTLLAHALAAQGVCAAGRLSKTCAMSPSFPATTLSPLSTTEFSAI